MACITKRGGRYVIDFYDQNGKRNRETLKEGTTKDNARKALRDIEEKVDRGTFLHDKKMPTFKEVAQQWLDYKNTSQKKIRITSWKGYEGIVKNHFHDIDDLKINMVTIAVIEKMMAKKQEQGASVGLITRVFVILNQVMKYAVRHRFIDYNPVRDTERPSQQDNAFEKKIEVWTPGQVNAFLDAVTDQKYRMLFMVAIMTGARFGELMGLKWSDVDLAKKELHIQRTFYDGKFFDPKTRAGVRTIDLSPIVIRDLMKWKLACPPHEMNLVFPSEDGTPLIHCNVIEKHFKPVIRKLGLPAITFHKLRHLHVSYLIDQKESITYIQRRLGHANPGVTLKVYSHALNVENYEAVCKLEERLLGTGHKMVTEVGKADVNV